jgi:DNA polymerase-3 subunit beta
VLPRDVNKTLVLEKDELQSALRRVAQLADQRTHAVKFMFSNEGLEVSSSSPDYGEAKEVIGKEYKGDTVAIGFNAQYLLDFLAAAADGPISFELKDEQSAGQLRPVAKDGSDASRYRYVVMPMRI